MKIISLPYLEMALALPYILLTQGIYTGVITMIGGIVTTSYGIVKSIYTYKQLEVTNFIKKLDIERRLELIEAVLGAKHMNLSTDAPGGRVDRENCPTIPPDHIELQLINDYQGPTQKKKDPIELCLYNLSAIIREIHSNLKDIDIAVAYHNKKWFRTWRKFNIKPKLDLLETNSHILDKRFHDLIEISNYLSAR